MPPRPVLQIASDRFSPAPWTFPATWLKIASVQSGTRVSQNEHYFSHYSIGGGFWRTDHPASQRFRGRTWLGRKSKET